MDKPVSVALDDMKRAIWREINTMRLPATILEPVLGRIHSELVAAAQQELAFDRQSYENSVKEEEAAKSEDKNRSDH